VIFWVRWIRLADSGGYVGYGSGAQVFDSIRYV